MKLKDKIESGYSALKVVLFNKRIPLAVRFQLSNRCDHRCLYCNVWNTKSGELSTEEVFSLLNELKKMGAKTISFSGGEPLLREDIGEIIDYCKNLNISPSMNSRGALIEKKIRELKNLDQIKVSIDGPEEIHDFLARKKSAYQQSIRTVETALAYGMQVILTTTITKFNLDHLEFVLQLAEKYNILVAFQPLKRLARGVEDMADIYPEVEKYKKVIERLILLKEKGYKHMRNSLIGLRHIWHWPNYNGRLPCAAGKIFCIIETNGDLYPCDRIRYPVKLPNCRELGFERAFAMLPPV
ncbi:MAG: radical SAM protein, partial [Planctomycetota bacterium]|nr:radical SAM protein [Planctomycetota bacterium]